MIYVEKVWNGVPRVPAHNTIVSLSLSPS